MSKSTSMINENRLFKHISDFFSNPSAVLIEIAQNAARAGATKLDITIDEANNILSAGDNGKGINDPAPLFILADSVWSDEIEEIQNPAGWGNYFLIALSEQITYRSNFGSISFDCNRFLDKSDYRNQVLSAMDNFQSCSGFYLEAKLKPGLAGKILAEKNIVSFFELDITVNGEPVEKKSLSKIIDNCQIVTEYQGNKVGIELAAHLTKYDSDVNGVWYGIPIPNNLALDKCVLSRGRVLIDIKNGSPLTPVLPYRHGFKKDQKMQEFMEFIRKTSVEYCINFLNNKNSTNAWHAIEISNIILSRGTQEEINRLERICLNNKEPYSRSSFECWNNEAFVSKGETIVNEQLQLFIDNKEIPADKYPDVFLPADTVKVYDITEKKPYWLNVENKVVIVKITSSKAKAYKGFYEWKKAKISCEGKHVKTVGIIQDYNDGTVYYDSAPENFYDIKETVFSRRYFDDQKGQCENQEWDFDEEIAKDIRNITKHYNLNHLLHNFHDVQGISPFNITAIKINRKKGLMEICLGKKKKLLKVA